MGQKLHHLLGIVLAGIIVSGCSSPLDDGPYTNWIKHDPDNWRVSGGAYSHSSSTLASQLSADSSDDIPTDAGPEEYVHLVLLRNPSLKAAQLKIARLTERIPQAESLNDPMFQIAPFGEMAQTADGEVVVMTSLSQKLPYPGKLNLRGRIANQNVAMAVQDYHDARLVVIADTRRAYWNYYFTQRGIEVIEADRKLLEQFKQVAQAKYRAGTATQQDVLRATVELSNLDNELITLGQRQTTAQAMLNNLLDRRIDAPLPKPKVVQLNQISANLDTLLAQAAKTNPKLKKIHERIQSYRERLKLARLNRMPDLTVNVSYNIVDDSGTAMSANGDDQWWFGFGVNLPIWQAKLDAAEQEAAKGIFEGVADLTGQQNRVAFRIQDALVKVETQQRLVILFRDVIIPQAKQTVAASESGYRSGNVDFLTLTDNWRKLLDFELMYHQSLAQLEQNFAQLQQVVGSDLDRQTKTNNNSNLSNQPPHNVESKS